jgi:hypothetical protein
LPASGKKFRSSNVPWSGKAVSIIGTKIFFPAPLKKSPLISKIFREPLISFRSRVKFSVFRLRNYFSRQTQRTLTDLPGEERKNPEQRTAICRSRSVQDILPFLPVPLPLNVPFLNCFYFIIFPSFFRFHPVITIFNAVRYTCFAVPTVTVPLISVTLSLIMFFSNKR